MKRLLHYLRNMENTTTTYREMYEGVVLIQHPPQFDPLRGEYAPLPPEEGNSTTYYSDMFSFRIEYSHKLAQDKPTVILQIPCMYLAISERSVTAADFCLRQWIKQVDCLNKALENRSRPDKENGKYEVYRPGGKRIRNNGAFFAECNVRDYEYGRGNVICMTEDEPTPPELCLCLRMQIQLPHKKLRKVMQMFSRDLPDAVEAFLKAFDRDKLTAELELASKQAQIRKWLENSPYCAFLANGSIFPRQSGTDLPMADSIPFIAPKEDTITVCGVTGMGIRRGVTVITGGGYSGKSTVLDAIASGIYDHVQGDGRELCITDARAMTIAAEDGRAVQHLDISPFLHWIPGKTTDDFSTKHASGATSQASNIMEAVDMGVKLLLIDEDKSATNFMIRDAVMQKMIRKEPIIPFTDRVRELYCEMGVSTILVIGGSGEFLSVADSVYLMDDFQMVNATDQAKEFAAFHERELSTLPKVTWTQNRILGREGFSSYPTGSGSERLIILDERYLYIGDEKIDVHCLYDLVSAEQLHAIGLFLRNIMLTSTGSEIDLVEKVQRLFEKTESEDIDFLYTTYFTQNERFLALPRKEDIYAVVNRMRGVNFKKGSKTIL